MHCTYEIYFSFKYNKYLFTFRHFENAKETRLAIEARTVDRIALMQAIFDRSERRSALNGAKLDIIDPKNSSSILIVFLGIVFCPIVFICIPKPKFFLKKFLSAT